MSAIGGPDEHSHTEQHPERSEQYNSIESGFEYDPNYQPEREFVLMPLFRRIGAMLGLGRNQEPDDVYPAEQSPPAQEPVVRAGEPQDEIVLPETAIQYSEPQLPGENQPVISSAPVVDDRHEQPSQRLTEEHIFQPDSAAPEQMTDNFVQEPAEELERDHLQASGSQFQQGSSATPGLSEDIANEPLVATGSEAPELEPAPSPMEEWPAPPEPASTFPVSARKRSPDEVRQLVAPLREAAVKITAIVAQAAEWLRAKEEEFLRSTEAIAAESKREQESLRRSPQQDLQTENMPAMPLQNEVAGVQRELRWREKSEQTASYPEPEPVPIQFIAKPDRPMTPSVPFWKRINWGEEFTPKRVAVLGGLVMAVLLVLGISFARRPASSVLPEQQTRSIEPGGVTVTTHPLASPVPPQVLRKTLATDRPSPVPQHRSRRASAEAYDDEPDVVIHHYDTAKKPSPVKQTTVAGVRHYSDM